MRKSWRLRATSISLGVTFLLISTLTGCSSTTEVDSVKSRTNQADKVEKNNKKEISKGQKDSNDKPNNSSSNSKVNVENIKLVKKQQKTKYLLTNGIEIINKDKTISTSRGEATISIIQIDGLVDKTLQDKLNKAIEQDVEKEIKAYTKELTDRETQSYFYCGANLNANNLLTISIYDMYSPVQGFLYRITDGERLYLKDIFTSGTDYVALINRNIREIMAGESFEEHFLREPFSTINKDQGFILSEDSLTMIFTLGEGGFISRNSVLIPLSQLDDYVDVTDRYSGTERKKHEKSNLIVRKNNIFTDQKGDVVKLKNGNVWTYYPKISGLRDNKFEGVINTSIKEGIDEVLMSSTINEMSNAFENGGDPIATVEMDVTFNHYGLICIKRYVYCNNENNEVKKFDRIFTFDLKKKKAVEVKDLLQDYFNRNKKSEEAFVRSVKEKLNESYSSQYNDLPLEVDSKVDAAFIKEQGNVYFAKSHIYDTYIQVFFNAGAFEGIPVVLECQMPFSSIVDIAHEDFFGW